MAERLYNHAPSTERLADELEKPIIDDRTYRVIRLQNKLEALLIHDDGADKAAAAMDVNVGSLANPEDLQGVAHAVEHLLFMGTEKYPDESDYRSYLTKFGGDSNAFTASTSTNYYFQVNATSTASSPDSAASNPQLDVPVEKHEAPLYGALDRFAQFFIQPLFLEDTLDRELRAVDSEHKKNLQNDTWRLSQLNKSLSSKAHPWHTFSTGNYKTLHDEPIARGVKIRDEFIKFYEKHYSANRMRLVVLGRESLDQLQSWVEELFSDVVNKDLPKLRWDDVEALSKENLGLQIFAKPVMEERMIKITFPYPDEDELYASQPSRYIGHLIGHEGPGSILAYLKEKGWANSLSAGADDVCPGTAFFGITIRLTVEGLKNYQAVLQTVFQYIAMLKEQPPQKWIFEEKKRLSEIEFKYSQKASASHTVSHLAGVMQYPLPREWILSEHRLVRTFDPDAILRGLDCLRLDNFRFTIVSQDFPGDWNMKEKVYGTEYKYEKIPSNLMDQLASTTKSSSSTRPQELHLPAKNEFIPQRLDVEKKTLKEPLRSPKLIRHDANVRTWFKKDDRFWVPKANIKIWLRSPRINDTSFTAVAMNLYQELVDDTLQEYIYDAELAGLEYGVRRYSDALELSFNGYNDKLHVLVEKVLLALRDLEVKQDRFDILKERQTRAYKNQEFSDPYRQVLSYDEWLRRDRLWAIHEMRQELPAVTADDVKTLGPQLLRQMHIEILVHGNMYKEDALRVTDLVEGILKPRSLPQSQWTTSRDIILPPGSDYLYQRILPNPDNVNHCIDYALQIGDAQDRVLRARLFVLDQILDDPVFDTLRSKEQLGYVVWGFARFSNASAFYRVIIQSSKECSFLEQRIDNFFIKFEEQIKKMSDKDFEEHKTGVINSRLEKLRNLDQETSRLWTHITSEAFDFECAYRDVEYIKPITKEEILAFYQKHFLPNAPSRAKLSVHLVAQASAADVATSLSMTEQRDKLAESIAAVLAQLGVTADPSTLSSHFANVDLAGGDVKNITLALSRYLKEALGMASEQVEKIVEQGQAILLQILPSLGIATASTTSDADAGSSEKVAPREETSSKTVYIKDVKAFKASLPLTAGLCPVKDIHEFEDLEAKL